MAAIRTAPNTTAIERRMMPKHVSPEEIIKGIMSFICSRGPHVVLPNAKAGALEMLYSRAAALRTNLAPLASMMVFYHSTTQLEPWSSGLCHLYVLARTRGRLGFNLGGLLLVRNICPHCYGNCCYATQDGN